MTDLEIQKIETRLKRKLTKRERHLLELAKTNGTDKDLVLMNAIDDLDEKVDEEIKGVKQEFKETIEKIKNEVPNLNNFLKSVKGKDGEDGHTPTDEELMALMGGMTEDEMNEMKKEMMAYCEQEMMKMEQDHEKMSKETREEMNFIRDKVREIKDGKDADEAKVAQEASKLAQEALKPLIPTLDTPDQILDRITGLIEIEDIKGLKDELEELRKLKTQRIGGGFSKIAMDGHIIDDEVPAGTVNGVNANFTINHIPNPSASLKVFVNGQKLKLTEDYTISGKTITFNTAPPTGSILLTDYRI